MVVVAVSAAASDAGGLSLLQRSIPGNIFPLIPS